MKDTNMLIIGVVAIGALYYLFRMGGMDQIKSLVGGGGGSSANASFPFTDDLLNGDFQGFSNDLQNYIRNAISQAGGDPNGSFQNLSIHRNINTSGGGGHINQSFNQNQQQSNS